MLEQRIIPKEQDGVVVAIKINKRKGIIAKGKSRCNFSEGDKFDVGLGTEIAVTRSEISYEKQRKQMYLKQAKSLAAQAKHFESLANKCGETIAQYEEAIQVRLSV